MDKQNYYEILNLPATATTGEIAEAIDGQYNQVRRLTTHHDPEVVNQANQILLSLERMRGVLLDPRKRTDYDANLGMGGLADPSLPTTANAPTAALPFIGPASTPGTAPHAGPGPVPPPQRSWVCPKCSAPNALNSQFCKRCGEVLAAPCPSCGVLAESRADFCPNCGVNIRKAAEKKTLEGQIAGLRAEFNRVTQNVPAPDSSIPEANRLMVRGAGWAVASFLAGLTFLTSAPGKFPVPPALNMGLAVVGLVLLAGAVLVVSLMRRASPLNAFGAAAASFIFTVLPLMLFQRLRLEIGSIPSILVAHGLAILVYLSVAGSLIPLTRKFFQSLKPVFPRLPPVGLLGGLFALCLRLTPLFYFFLLSLAMAGMPYQQYAFEYENPILLLNGLQYLILGVLLTIYVLLALKQAQTVEVWFRQVTAQRAETMERLARQIQTLETTAGGIDIRTN